MPGPFLRVTHHHAVAAMPTSQEELWQESLSFSCFVASTTTTNTTVYISSDPHLQDQVWKQATDQLQVKTLTWQVKQVRSSAG